ncbi:MAG TPA: LysR family transcriptional regulator [Polyangiaceae bacterium]|nr:LysR family transcriptional regulator [Polyangiaceae bacterium]
MTLRSLSGTLPNVVAFCSTFETGSFTTAARALGVTPQATSRSVARLERTLGVTLFRRTTRSLAPTEAARRYYERCTQALSLFTVAETEVAAVRKAPEGLVRVSVPTTYGHHRFLPSLGAFREIYPGVRLEINVGSRNVDFVREGFDLAIRMGRVADASLVARKLGDFALGVYAAPSYLARFGVPRTPAELAAHACVAFLLPSSGRVLPWAFAPGPKAFVPDAAYRCTDDALGTIALARAGVGLVQTYDFLVTEDVERGRLVEVLADYRGPSRPFSLVYPKGVKPSPAVRALIDHVVEGARGRARGGRAKAG